MKASRRALAFGIAGIAALAAAAVWAETANYLYFFTADNDAYKAYLDLNNQGADGAGYKLVNTRLDTFSDAFRGWIKKNFPGGETAEYAIDPYSIDCADKTVGEHRIVFYDANHFPLTDYDFGGKMAPPIAGTMKGDLMNKVCGF